MVNVIYNPLLLILDFLYISLFRLSWGVTENGIQSQGYREHWSSSGNFKTIATFQNDFYSRVEHKVKLIS